ncbi:DUF1365 domain-containing protein [Vibrio sp. SCSIO 43132]|uniref:DUF1365 domain-containing protein n=1 Tax=Vibrio sp. SCSIO 43132 TaxID=2779363 RepID=UPI001CA9C8AE|nr:DUF1365 family protein [Vibrio sp. SCSIO 43132]UAB69296.1 DUF1365 domain-containing protein [Vibrio sp. SCSIO 43132]
MTFSSCMLEGEVTHRRFSPVKHSLRYPLFMPCLDLDEVEHLKEKLIGFGDKRWHWARFRREDYVGSGDLKEAVQQKVRDLTGVKLKGKVKAVCHLRYFGIYFSPVNFYYLYDEQDEWRYLLAEVSNTPWNERHYYAVKADPGEQRENWKHDKEFHVSPFNPIEQQYVWSLKPLNNKLMVHLECHQEEKVFDASMVMDAKPLNRWTLIRYLVKTPIMAVKVVVGIYWHALKLWVKGANYYSHPDNKNKETPHAK